MKVQGAPAVGPIRELTPMCPFALEITTKKRKLGKNPDVDTSFLPDRDREVKAPDPGPSPGSGRGFYLGNGALCAP